jgi:4-aminobutyrate aminotransferase-like enzyme
VATRWNYLFVAPPLCIAEADLHAGLDVLDAVLGEETR